jgi:MFS family permease
VNEAPLRGGRTFAALANRNFRLYMVGQTISQAGTWMQTIGQAWLVLKLTDSGTALGVVAALQALPVLFLAPVGGLVIDRLVKRHVLMATQIVQGVLALVLWALTATDNVELWMVYALALALGMVLVFDNPVRQTMALELVGPDLLTNAVSLNNVNFNAARIVGPGIAGVVITTIGIAPCFFLNGVSYGAVVVAILMMRVSEMHPMPLQARGKRQLRDGLAFVWRTPELRIPVLVMFVAGTLTYETAVTLPLFAKQTFGGDADTFSAMSVAMGIGAVLGGLAVSTRVSASRQNFLVVTAVLGAAMIACAMAPTLTIALALLVVLGGCSVTFLAVANSTLQLTAPPTMRGRVMALWSVAFLGSAPIGGPIVGWIGEHIDARWAIAVGGIGPLVAAAVAWPKLRRLPGGLGAVRVYDAAA